MRIGRANVLTLLITLLLLFSPARDSMPETGDNNADNNAAAHLTFVRQVSTAQDVKRDSNPILNRRIDIACRPKEVERVIDALDQPSAVTRDSADRVLVTDVMARAVHVFDFVPKYWRLGATN